MVCFKTVTSTITLLEDQDLNQGEEIIVPLNSIVPQDVMITMITISPEGEMGLYLNDRFYPSQSDGTMGSNGFQGPYRPIISIVDKGCSGLKELEKIRIVASGTNISSLSITIKLSYIFIISKTGV